MTTTYHHGDLKSTLLTYALQQMEGESAGLDGLSMREMAKAVGVSHTAAYRHFADKQSLLDAVAEEGFTALLQASRDAVDAVPASMGNPGRLLACGLAYIGFGRQHPRQLAHMFTAASRADAPASLRTVAAQLFDLLITQVVHGQQEGQFREGDARALAHSCWAMVHGLALLQGGQLLTPTLPPDLPPDAPQANSETLATQQARNALEVLLQGLLKA